MLMSKQRSYLLMQTFSASGVGFATPKYHTQLTRTTQQKVGIDIPITGTNKIICFASQLSRVERLLKLVNLDSMHNRLYNCHGAASHIMFGEKLEDIDPAIPLGEEMSLEKALEIFELPCGFQLRNGSKVIYSGVLLGEHDGEIYIYHKLAKEKSEVVEISDGLYYYPNHTSITFYGDKKHIEVSPRPNISHYPNTLMINVPR